MLVYAIFDLKVGAYQQPWTSQHDVTAKRMLRKAMMNPDNLFSAYPEDFALYRLGSYLEDTGSFVSEGGPVFVCNLKDLVS